MAVFKTVGQARDAVVGLAAVGHNKRNAQGAHKVGYGRDLLDEGFGRGRALGLIGRVKLVAEGGALAVQGEHKMTRPLLL